MVSPLYALEERYSKNVDMAFGYNDIPLSSVSPEDQKSMLEAIRGVQLYRVFQGIHEEYSADDLAEVLARKVEPSENNQVTRLNAALRFALIVQAYVIQVASNEALKSELLSPNAAKNIYVLDFIAKYSVMNAACELQKNYPEIAEHLFSIVQARKRIHTTELPVHDDAEIIATMEAAARNVCEEARAIEGFYDEQVLGQYKPYWLQRELADTIRIYKKTFVQENGCADAAPDAVAAAQRKLEGVKTNMDDAYSRLEADLNHKSAERGAYASFKFEDEPGNPKSILKISYPAHDLPIVALIARIQKQLKWKKLRTGVCIGADSATFTVKNDGCAGVLAEAVAVAVHSNSQVLGSLPLLDAQNAADELAALSKHHSGNRHAG